MINKKNKYLFFFVHPSKYYLFRHTINTLKSIGHCVDIAIISKDVLEDLVKNEGWDYVNIFPEGRRSKSTKKLLILWNTGINFFKTVWRLHRLTAKKKYDMYITDDCLTINGWYRRIPCYMCMDDDLEVVPEVALLYRFATNILAPRPSNLGKFNTKKISYDAYHELAYLHPSYFIPDHNVIYQFNPENKRFFILRLVSLTASHDINKNGIDNHKLKSLIHLLSNYGLVFISSERPLSPEFEKLRLKIQPHLIAHALFFADMFIGDSQTMNTEAALLGTPAIRFNDFVGKISTMNEIEYSYGLSIGFRTTEFDSLLIKVEEMLKKTELKILWQKKREKLLADKIDLNKFLIDYFLAPYPIDKTNTNP